MSDQPKVRAHVWVAGRVQGVFFRQETQRRARAQGLAGWVRNLQDGRVEAVFEGAGAGVEALVAWSRIGPNLARVDELTVEWEPLQGDSSFRIRP